MIQTHLNLKYLETAVNPTFANHETFHPRFGWLKKGFDAAKKNPGVFLLDDAPVRLGVGKNMVRAIRYWCSAFKLIDKNNSPTTFGEKLLGSNGWDAYLEDPASLWLLHWNLLKPTCEAAAWYYIFNVFRDLDFTKEDILVGLQDYIKSFDKKIADSSFMKDISCILRMYATQEFIRDNSPIEDSIDCPFNELGLIRHFGKSYQFKIGAKANLPASVIVATCLEYASWANQDSNTITIRKLLYDEGSPGMVFKLTESVLLAAIEKVTKEFNAIILEDTAGLIQLSSPENPEILAEEILDRYYLRE
ncbi:DUF4007 family protein [Nostoc spongiaeforme FACHB-130]|uniref:DUF4007 family protein n=1 Tax=Nostoc spongiaeforme FACHB-130 TaxID=1357510 RepID=A0ABR8FWY1_9NOSO|nr:DUF4007 family protein [Nostoc spongiaeforme]MBD2595935.1 DUF4007 family protein [Nostoc spongiaeforme FACHB-130]